MMRLAPAMRAPWMTLRPTPPRPNTATVAPASTFAVYSTAPTPVVMPQPSRHTLSSGDVFDTTHTAISGSTVYSLKHEVPMKWKIVWPLQVKRDVPSGMTP